MQRSRFLVWVGLVVLMGSSPGLAQDEASRARIQVLEKKLAAMKPGEFEWALHNELIFHYGKIDPKKSKEHVNTIFENSLLDDYMFIIHKGKEADPARSIENLTQLAEKSAEYPAIVASCWVRISDLENNPARSRAALERAVAVKGVGVRLKRLVNDRVVRAKSLANAKPWPVPFRAPAGMANAPGPWRDPVSTTVWPNTKSRANSDPWIAENHDKIRKMNPRVLVINFSNQHPRAHLDGLIKQYIKALAESSRYQGYRNPKAPVFIQFEQFKFVDLRDRDRKKYDSRKFPLKDPNRKSGINLDYGALFSEAFAREIGVADPRDPKRMLRLDELVDGGYVHEVWLITSGDAEPGRNIASLEVVEEKPVYDEQFRKKGNQFVQAGNGGDSEQPWTGRSLRINSISASRGIGCAMENVGHGLEGLSGSKAIPYFSRYFREFAGFDLTKRYQLPVDSLYAVNYGEQQISYPDDHTMVVAHNGKSYRVDNYVCIGGNVHFPPNGRRHYDLDNDRPVMSTIEDWRIGSGKAGADLARPFTNAAFERYRDLAPDCMGAWLVYWRQNMPGLDNRQKDDAGRPMKNWWPFLFY